MVFIDMAKRDCNSNNEPSIRRGNMTDEEWINYMDSFPVTILEEGEEDPTIVRLQPGETLEDYMKRNNLVNGDEIIAQIKNIVNSYSQKKLNDK